MHVGKVTWYVMEDMWWLVYERSDPHCNGTYMWGLSWERSNLHVMERIWVKKKFLS